MIAPGFVARDGLRSILAMKYTTMKIWYDRRMKLNGTFCIALRYGKCGIYEKRPRVCRQFQPGCSRCINYRNGHLNGHKEFSIGDITEIS